MSKTILFCWVVAAVAAIAYAAPVADEEISVVQSSLPDTTEIQSDTASKTEAELPIDVDSLIDTEHSSSVTSGSDTQSEFDIEVEEIPPIDTETTSNSVVEMQLDTKTVSEIQELLDLADPIENDISAPKTDASDDLLISTTILPITTKTTLMTEDYISEAVTPTTTTNEVENNDIMDEISPEKQTLNDTSEQTSIQNTIETHDIVLGEYADKDEEIVVIKETTTDFQIVKGENEAGTLVIYEYDPSTHTTAQDIQDNPIVESVVYDYPPDNIMPASVFRPDQYPGEMDYPRADMYDEMSPSSSMSSGMDYGDYDHEAPNSVFYPDISSPDMLSTYLDHSPPLHTLDYPNMDYPNIDYPNTDYPDTDYPNTDYPNTDYPNTDFSNTDYPDMDYANIDYSTDYTSENEGIMEKFNFNKPMLTVDTPMMDSYPMLSNLPSPDVIVAGANENYNPEPILGMIPPQDMVSPLVPDLMPMIEPSVEISTLNIPEPEMQMDNELVIASDDMPVDLDTFITPKKEIVIKLDFTNEEAFVNGEPFTIREPSNLLGFIEKLLNVAAMSARIPPYEDVHSSITRGRYYFNPFMNKSPMQEELDYKTYDPYFYASSYGQEPSYEDQYPSSFSYDDYPPMHPFFSGLKRRLTMSRLNALRSSRNPFGYDSSSRFQRSAPYYYGNNDPWYSFPY